MRSAGAARNDLGCPLVRTGAILSASHKGSAIMSIIRRLGVVLLAIGAMAAAPLASAQPSFSKQFQPDSMGPGSASLLRFQISNNVGVPVTDLAFTDVLPAGVTLATPAHPTTTCTDGLIAAPDGGGTISFSNGRVGGNASCVVDVYVTASTLGT